MRLRGHEAPISSLAISADGDTVLSTDQGGEVKAFSIKLRKELPSISLGNGCTATFSENGQYAAVAGGTTTTIFNSVNWKPLASLNTRFEANSVSISMDSRLLAVGCGQDFQGGNNTQIFHLQTLEEAANLHHPYSVRGVAFSPVGPVLATACPGDTARIWNLSETLKPKTFWNRFSTPEFPVKKCAEHDGGALPVCFSPNGTLLASGPWSSSGDPHPIRLWNTGDASEYAALRGHTDRIDCLAFSPSGRLLASAARDGTFRLWDLNTLKQVAAIDDRKVSRPLIHDDALRFIGFLGGDRHIVTASQDMSLIIWEYSP